MGHVRDLPEKGKTRPRRRARLRADLRDHDREEGHGRRAEEARPPRPDIVYLATDPDREGEAIAWHLQEALGLPDERVRRVTFHEITERAVKEAFRHVGPINMDMVNAQQARRFLDRFVGYQLSPLLWKQGRAAPQRRAGAVGRRPADRRPREGDPGVRLRGILEDHRDAQPGRLDGRGRPLRGGCWPSGRGRSSRPRTRPTPAPSATPWPRPRTPSPQVEEIEKLDKADPPFKTSTLQQQGAIRLRFSGKRTMKIAQELYEGIDVDGTGPGRPDHLHADRQPPRLRRGAARPSAT